MVLLSRTGSPINSPDPPGVMRWNSDPIQRVGPVDPVMGAARPEQQGDKLMSYKLFYAPGSAGDGNPGDVGGDWRSI